MKRLLFVETLAIALAFVIAACGGAPAAAPQGGTAAPAPASKPNTLTAVKVDATTLDAAAPYWAQAPKLDVSTITALPGKPGGPAVSIQAAYDDKYLVIRSEWPDATNTLTRNTWTWDGTKFTRAGQEDFISFIWPIGNNATFASKGCAATCHNTSPDQAKWWMGSDGADVRYDGWFWMSARTNPVGYTNDIGWSILSDPTDMGSPRVADAVDSGGFVDNTDGATENPSPKFMSSKDLKSLLLLDADKVAFDKTKLAAGDTVPGFVLAKAVGSLGDIEANGVWANGKWVVVQRRMLNTTHPDDAVLIPSKPTPFGLAVADAAGDADHKISQEVLTLEWK
ncbi:MAG: ethylbenzene dehydrogenase-related protein [Chloroflexales bacterium]